MNKAIIPTNPPVQTGCAKIAISLAVLAVLGVSWPYASLAQATGQPAIRTAAFHAPNPPASAPAFVPPKPAARATQSADSPPSCSDEEPPGSAILTALYGGETAFLQLVREKPAEAFRCASLFPSAAATAALQEAVLAAPFDAIGAADQLLNRPGGAAIVAAALDRDLLLRSLDNGLPYFETRHELIKRLPPSVVRLVEERAFYALTAAFLKDPQQISMGIGALVDDMVEDPPKERFRVISAMTADQVYELIARIGPQLYTSSLGGLFDIMLAKLRHEKRNLTDLATAAPTRAQWSKFFTAVVSGGRADDLFGRLAGNPRDLAKISVRAMLVAGTDFDPPIVAGSLADALDTRYVEVRAALEDELAEAHRTVTDPLVRSVAGLAGGLHSLRLAGQPTTAAFQAERFAELYPVSTPPALAGARLFHNGINVQRTTFYDDPDGRASFRGFIKQHRAMGWAIQDQTDFVLVLSPERLGRRIIIVADIPWAGDKGRKAAREWLTRQGLSPTIVVHRGHSYHEDATMPEIDPGTALVFWGSCGGHLRLRATLDQAPDALVLATQSIGVSSVNQTLLQIIEERLLADGTIDWAAVWAQANRQVRDKRFAAYKRPDQDSTNLALRAWRDHTGQGASFRNASFPSAPLR